MNVGAETKKLLEEHIGVSFCDLELSNDCLYVTPKALGLPPFPIIKLDPFPICNHSHLCPWMGTSNCLRTSLPGCPTRTQAQHV